MKTSYFHRVLSRLSHSSNTQKMINLKKAANILMLLPLYSMFSSVQAAECIPISDTTTKPRSTILSFTTAETCEWTVPEGLRNAGDFIFGVGRSTCVHVKGVQL